MLIKKFSLNQLTIRTFTVFWLAFFAMTALLVALPYFDSRLYSDLNQNEISSYQKKLVESIRNNRITGILAGVPVLPTDKFDSARPVIMTPEKEILRKTIEINPIFARPGEITSAPVDRFPTDSMLPETAYQIVHDESMLDGNARLNLATDPEIVKKAVSNIIEVYNSYFPKNN